MIYAVLILVKSRGSFVSKEPLKDEEALEIQGGCHLRHLSNFRDLKAHFFRPSRSILLGLHDLQIENTMKTEKNYVNCLIQETQHVVIPKRVFDSKFFVCNKYISSQNFKERILFPGLELLPYLLSFLEYLAEFLCAISEQHCLSQHMLQN